MKVHITTLGCRLNQAESERIAQGFILAGHDITPDNEQADLLVINSCTVTREAGKKSVRAARRRPGQKVVVTGCHSEVLPEQFRDADLVVASADKENLVALTSEALGTDGFALGADYRPDGTLYLYPLVLDHTRAFVKIQDGCNLSCSFCLTTIARGASRSRRADEVVAEVSRLATLGCREVVLTGVHAGSYGGGDSGLSDLGELIDRILGETEIPRLRLSSLEPWNFKTTWLELWRKWEGRLCRHLHMSLQSGSDTVLRRMRRAYSADGFADKVRAARAVIPEVAISTDLIVGFPGESEEEHRESMAFVEEMGFSSAHIFTFSPRPGTRAAAMGGQLSNAIKKRRYREMKALTDRSEREFRSKMRNTIQPVLWEQRREDGLISGLTDTYLRVYCRDGGAEPNRIDPVLLGAPFEDGVEGTLFRGNYYGERRLPVEESNETTAE